MFADVLIFLDSAPPPLTCSDATDRHAKITAKLKMSTVTAPLPLSADHAEELLSRTLPRPLQAEEQPFEQVYELDRTVRLLKEGGFQKVGLQLPDDLLYDAAELSKRLQQAVHGL